MAWNDYHRIIIDRFYHSSPEYGRHKQFLDDLYAQEWIHLIDLNCAIIMELLKVFQIQTPVLKSSALSCLCDGQMKVATDNPQMKAPHQSAHPGIKRGATQQIIEFCQEIGADTYLSGSGGRNYLDLSLFEDAEIAVEFQEFHHPSHPQRYTPFIENLAALDYILNNDTTDSRQRDRVKSPGN